MASETTQEVTYAANNGPTERRHGPNWTCHRRRELVEL